MSIVNQPVRFVDFNNRSFFYDRSLYTTVLVEFIDSHRNIFCRPGSKVPFNTLTGVIDGNTVYGVTEGFSRHLRSGYSGLLRMNPVFSEFGLKELLPLKLDVPEEGCTRANGSEYCFEAGK